MIAVIVTITKIIMQHNRHGHWQCQLSSPVLPHTDVPWETQLLTINSSPETETDANYVTFCLARDTVKWYQKPTLYSIAEDYNVQHIYSYTRQLRCRVWTGPVPGSGPGRSLIFFWTGAGPCVAYLTYCLQENSLKLLFSTKFTSNCNQHTEFKAQYRLHRHPKSQ